MREQRRVCLLDLHKYVITLVANHLQLDNSAVEEFVLDSEKVICLIICYSVS